MKELPHLHIAAATVISLSLLSLAVLPSKTVEAKHHDSSSSTHIEPSQEVSTSPPLVPTETSEQAQTQTKETKSLVTLPEALELKVKSGDTLVKLFEKAGLSAKTMYKVLQSQKQAKELARLTPGNQLDFVIDSEQLLSITLHQTKLQRIIYQQNDAGSYERKTVNLEPQKRIRFSQTTIQDSLFLAGYKAGLGNQTIMNLANIFGWDIDFMLDIRKGDSFTLLYEENYLDGEKLGDGDILAASFTNRGKTYKAVRYTDNKGLSHYFTPEGNSMRKEFLRSPVDFARISSSFNLKRKHPILNTIRAHKGVDYAAPRNTPIRSAGDGKVIFAGWKGGWGRTLIVQHGQKYQTLYAHLNKFHKNIRKGVKVKQGQTVAYVGSTGLATGPHLHYEFRVNGAVRNPVTVKLPKANAIPKAERMAFFQKTGRWLAQLEQFSKAWALNELDLHPRG